MTEKPVKPLSERIREDEMDAYSRAIRYHDQPLRSAVELNHSNTLRFLAELAEMMEKK